MTDIRRVHQPQDLDDILGDAFNDGEVETAVKELSWSNDFLQRRDEHAAVGS